MLLLFIQVSHPFDLYPMRVIDSFSNMDLKINACILNQENEIRMKFNIMQFHIYWAVTF